MIIELNVKDRRFKADLSSPLDISLPLRSGAKGPKCFYAPDFSIAPYQSGDFVGAVKQGAPVNFYNVQLNPHGNGTHTESVGHISESLISINDSLKEYHFFSQVISVAPERLDNGDLVITKDQLSHVAKTKPKALIIRTLPNKPEKRKKDYSGTNPPYLDFNAIQLIVDAGVEHLLVDLPSVDREEDNGEMKGHKTFWNFPNENRNHCTITEMIFVDYHINDGLYLLNIQIAPFEMDATPSKPILYALERMND